MCIDVYIYIYVVSKKKTPYQLLRELQPARIQLTRFDPFKSSDPKMADPTRNYPDPPSFLGRELLAWSLRVIITNTIHWDHWNVLPKKVRGKTPEKMMLGESTILSLTFRWLSQRRTFAFSFWGVLHMESIKITSNICTKFYPPKNGTHVTTRCFIMDFPTFFFKPGPYYRMAPLVSPSTPPIMV